MKKALVTGAAGFIGSNVVRELMNEGVHVRALILPGEDLQNLEGLDIEHVVGNVLDPDSLRKAIKGCDTLFHLAAIYKFWISEPRQIYEVNIRGSNNMLLVAREADVEKIVYTSSIAAVGLEPGQQPSTEETAFNWFQHRIDYVLSKYISEMNALDMARFGLPVVAVNPAVPFGPRDIAPTPSGKIVVDVVNNNFPGYIDSGLCVVDVRDVARGQDRREIHPGPQEHPHEGSDGGHCQSGRHEDQVPKTAQTYHVWLRLSGRKDLGSVYPQGAGSNLRPGQADRRAPLL